MSHGFHAGDGFGAHDLFYGFDGLGDMAQLAHSSQLMNFTLGLTTRHESSEVRV